MYMVYVRVFVLIDNNLLRHKVSLVHGYLSLGVEESN